MKMHTFVEPRHDLPYSGVVIEVWHHLKHGKQRREFEKSFTPNERQQCGKLYKLFYRWHMVKGLPDECRMTINTMRLAKRLIHFCATV